MEGKWFPKQVWEMFDDKRLDEILMECNIMENDRENATVLILVALWCVQFTPAIRPTMSNVVKMLEKQIIVTMPRNPFLHSDPSLRSSQKVKYPKAHPESLLEKKFEGINQGSKHEQLSKSLPLEPSPKSSTHDALTKKDLPAVKSPSPPGSPVKPALDNEAYSEAILPVDESLPENEFAHREDVSTHEQVPKSLSFQVPVKSDPVKVKKHWYSFLSRRRTSVPTQKDLTKHSQNVFVPQKPRSSNIRESTTHSDEDPAKLVFFDKRKQFAMEDLLQASAEVLGKGNLGTVYKAKLEDDCIVAVKRLKGDNLCAKKEFEGYMDVIGQLIHLNIVRLRAYYCGKDEKVLVYDYLSKGSLHSLLHGNRGPGRIPLDWTTRISLVLGAARGLARIHEEYSVSKIPHGNVKSSNVLIDKNGIACIADFGVALLLNPIRATAILGGYLAPEQYKTKKFSQNADVYSFGVLVLEMLTGKTPSLDAQGVNLPKWVRSVLVEEWTAEVVDVELLRYENIDEELMANMLQVGLACASQEIEKRPTMTVVVKMIEEIQVEHPPFVLYT